MAGNYYTPLPAYNPGPRINFEPINAALDSITQQNNRNALLAFQNKEFEANQAQRQFENARATKQDQFALIDRGARQANAIAQMPIGSPERNAAWAAHVADHKRDFPNDALTPDEMDPVTGPQIYASQAGLALESPGAVALRKAQIAEANASAAKSYAEVAGLQRQSSMINALMPELTGGQPQLPTNALMVPPSSAGGGPRNALMMPPSPSVVTPSRSTPPPANALRGPAQGGDTRSIPGIAISPPAPSTSLPAPGDPTSFTGDSNSGMTTPTRLSPDTMRAVAFDLAMNGGKGASSIINNDPGSQYAKTFANKTAEDNASLNFKQKMTKPMLDIVHGMREKLEAAGPDIANMATGPNYGQLSEDPSAIERFTKAPLPDTSGEFYQNARAGVRNIVNSTLGYIPGVSQYTRPLADRGNAARDLNLELHHLVKGIGAGVKAIPGSKGGGVSTDADQALVLDAVGEAMHSADAATRNNILFDAENILRARAGQPRLEAPPGYKPSYLASKYDARSAGDNTQAQPSLPQPRSQVEYQSLPSGTSYIDPEGNTRVKP